MTVGLQPQNTLSGMKEHMSRSVNAQRPGSVLAISSRPLAAAHRTARRTAAADIAGMGATLETAQRQGRAERAAGSTSGLRYGRRTDQKPANARRRLQRTLWPRAVATGQPRPQLAPRALGSPRAGRTVPHTRRVNHLALTDTDTDTDSDTTDTDTARIAPRARGR